MIPGLDHITDPATDVSWMLLGLRVDGTHAGGFDEDAQALPINKCCEVTHDTRTRIACSRCLFDTRHAHTHCML